MTVLLAEIEFDDAGNGRQPSPTEVATLRNGLQEMATEAELSQQFENVEVATYTEDTSSTPSIYFGDTVSSSSASAATTPLDFLQAALPHIDTDQLDKALNAAQADGEMDMWEVIANVLTAESIREMEERGLDDDDNMVQRSWETVTPKGVKKKKQTRTRTIAIADIRQQHHLHPQPQRRHTADPLPGSPDAWSQLASLSTHIASFVPSHESEFFLSYFHSPHHASPYAALCAALGIVRDSLRYTPDEHIPRYLELLNIILPMYEHLDAEEQSRMVEEAELCVIVTQEQDESALDLVTLLRDLDSDHVLGYQGMGIYHAPGPSPSPSPPKSATIQKLPAHPPPAAPPPIAKSRNNTLGASSNKPSPYQWQAVHKRRGPDRPPPVIPTHVPAYSRDVNGMKAKGKGGGNFAGKGGKSDFGELEMYRRRVGESMRRRDEMLREATRSWQRGTKARGGEVALFFAERVRVIILPVTSLLLKIPCRPGNSRKWRGKTGLSSLGSRWRRKGD